jgi:ATP adenylyltransferase
MPDVLFAPWRYEYLVADKSGGCIFCEALAAPGQEESLVVFRGRKVFVILNRYPYTNGHVSTSRRTPTRRGSRIPTARR